MSKPINKLILAVVIISAVSLPMVASAGLAETAATAFIELIFRTFGVFIQKVTGFLLELASAFLNLTLQMNIHDLNSTNVTINVGWKIARDIANLGFVLALIMVAMSTILRFQEYGFKKLLVRLIGAALLVNFSLTIAFLFINFSNVVTNFFLNQLGDPIEVGDGIVRAFGPQRFGIDIEPEEAGSAVLAPEETGGQVGTISEAFFVSMAGLVFAILFSFLTIVVIVAFAVMLLIRFVYLSILLILAPITWLFWVIPKMGKYFTQWWDKFIQWVFFAPAMAFFLYISLLSVRALGEAQIAVSDNTLRTIMGQGAQMVVLTAMMFGGLIAAQTLGIAGANMAMQVTRDGIKGAGKWTGRRAGELRDKALTAGTKEGKTALERLSTSGVGRALGRIPLAGRAITGISGVSVGAKERLKKAIGSEREKLKARSVEDINTMLERPPGFGTTEERGAQALESIKKGGWGKLSKAAQERGLQALQRAGMGEEALAVDPTLAGRFGMTIEEAVSKYVKNATELVDDALKNPDVVRSLNPKQLKDLGDQAPTDIKEGVARSLRNQLSAVGEDLFKSRRNLDATLQQLEDAKAQGDITAINSIIASRKQLQARISGLERTIDAKARTALASFERISKDTNWQDVPRNVFRI